MNSTSQSPGQKFPMGSGPNAMNNRTLYATLAASTAVSFVFILLYYASIPGHNPIPARLAYGIFVSALPALATFVVLKLTNLFVSWWGAVIVYVALFVLALIIQAYAR